MSQSRAPSDSPMNILLDVINHEKSSVKAANAHTQECMKLVQQSINTILDEIMVNTYDFIQIKPDIPIWRDTDELFDLEVINKESHQQVIQKLNEKLFYMHLVQGEKWKYKLKGYKEQLTLTQH
jgi:hypothetical protein